jgi:pyruvate dehydrogenase E2 component (dihydrolipoamide acetyltransferase)
MPNDLLMPALSPTMTEGTLAKWLKKEGDKIKPGDIIAEIETDKATMEFEATDSGVLGKILVSEGSAGVLVNTPIGVLLENGEDISILANYVSAPNEKSLVSQTEIKVDIATKSINEKVQECTERVLASPLARRIASQNGADLTKILGSGPNGRIVKNDVEKLTNSKQLPPVQIAGQNRIIPHTAMRKAIATRLLESKTTIPHFYLSVDVEVGELLKAREQINASAPIANEKPAFRVSVNDIIIKACAVALKAYPEVNASWSNEGMIMYGDVNISVAVSIEGGLITPIVKNAEQKTLVQISNEMKDLAKRARENKLRPEEFQGGGFSISNLGMFGINQFNAIINPPQSAILAVGATQRVPKECKDGVKFVDKLNLTISCDHRVVDGALAALFINKIKHIMEHPILMIL